MSIHAALHHVTHYQYDRPVQLGPQVIRLRPAPHCRSNVISYSLRVEPEQHFINWQQDPFANYLARLVFPEKTRAFKVTVDLVVEMAVYNPFDFFLEPQAENFPFKYTEAQAQELAPYLAAEPATPLVQAYLDKIDRKPQRTIDFLVGLNQQVQKDVDYLIRMEPGVQTPEQTLANGSGSCRDSGWLLVQLLRHVGLAARFVSGYLIQLTPDVKALDGPSGTTVDFTDLHAWCEVYLPGAGWIGLDATSGLMAGEGHIPLACTPTPSSAAPVEGAVDHAEVQFGHEMTITRIHESPRVTKPYTDAQWAEVLALGDAVDARLAAGDVRLTMGGEPTFVATTDRDAAEWNTDALGPTKRGYATELVHKLRAEYGQGGFLHFGQGKWYPGEQLPRWALSIFWRADGQPAWHDPALFADERTPARYTSEDARRFTSALAGRLGLTDRFVQAGYEDVYYYLWRERRLPVNVDPFDSKLDDELERERLRRVFTQKLDAVIGYMLPIEAGNADVDAPPLAGPGWKTGPWFLRDDRMYLIPGDSPMGYRLPLDSQPWVSKADYPYLIERDPGAPRAPLPGAAPHAFGTSQPSQVALRLQAARARAAEATGAGAQPMASVGAAATRQPQRGESAGWVTRSALCVEVRDPRRANGPAAEKTGSASGVLYVFMPPLARLEDYLDLVAAVEATARELGMQVVLEGYPPPRDPRLKMLQVTPDPGVIEVNIHPAHNWRELVAHTEFLYGAAFETRLSAEKFMTDGRHTGTGGGNHVVLGGATPADSPFLRRPELLASLLLYWHNHPSLSYLFSGMFIGPTSQAPRVDEARNDQLYELEIALAQIARNREIHGQHMPPWLVDRTLRNILVDVTGNTHRSEFCIDKLYSPDSSTGRLGLLELRAFEMPPHARMSIAQQLLLRALVARFWEAPYEAPATRWGTELHDRFLLPAFVKMDFGDVIAEMRQAGFAFDPEWFAPHLEFRFPLVGQVRAMGVELTLRNALEPWHVMGEEGAIGGTVRYVDSSLERIEVRVTGLNESRHVITVNGRALPLQPTGTVGEFVAGVRYKAWNPPSALHPGIGAHAPLAFDIVDTWMQRSLGGCRYFVAHPGGRNYETFPVNAYEAESRRHARFSYMGHTPGPMSTPAATIELAGSREFPFTLDLRRGEAGAEAAARKVCDNRKTLEPLNESLFEAQALEGPAALATTLAPAAAPGHFDELRGLATSAPPLAAAAAPDADAADRPALAPAWSAFFEHLGEGGFNDLPRRSVNLERQIRDNGVTYNVYADADGPQRPWSLDLFPLIVSADSWAQIEAGVQQRVHVLDRVMADVYGAQQLLAEGLLPPALVQGHPGYLRAMHGVRPPGDTWLHIAAFDLARGPDGNWWVVSQRTQAPSGLGYLLENRLAISRQFPQAFEALHVQRLAATYSAMIDALQRICPAGSPPHIVLLTPGPYSETYFEHAYLARYLGITLVEGSDLTVRDQRLYLKTLQGLRPVHGLIKRLDDEFLDPLELRPDSTLGVPGLLQAIRAGNVLAANMPGSAFLESPALLGFLPALARRLIGEKLQLPALPTWWCGERAAMEAVLPQLRDCAIKPTYAGYDTHASFDAVLGSRMGRRELDEWAGRIVRQGDEHTVQRYLPLSQMPTWSQRGGPGRIAPRSVLLRVFAVSDGARSWRVLPGGLARLLDASAQIASMRRGGSSADVWVQTHGAVDRTTLLQPHATPASLARHRAPVTSRAAENMFWLGRYTERAENAVRLARLTLDLLGGEDLSSPALLAWLHGMALGNALVPREVPSPPRSRRVFERALIAELGEAERGGSVGYSLRCIRQAAAAVRERLSQDHWNQIVRAETEFLRRCAELAAEGGDGSYASGAALRLLESASAALAAMTGAQTDRMTRDDAWRLLSIGRHIERLGFLSNALVAGLENASVHEASGFEAMIALFDSTITFHARYQQRRDVATMVDLLVLDGDNPRSLAWVTQTLRGRIARLAGSAPGKLSALSHELPDPAAWTLEGLCEADAQGRHPALLELLEACEAAAYHVSDAIGIRYFTLTSDPVRSVGA